MQSRASGVRSLQSLDLNSQRLQQRVSDVSSKARETIERSERLTQRENAPPRAASASPAGSPASHAGALARPMTAEPQYIRCEAAEELAQSQLAARRSSHFGAGTLQVRGAGGGEVCNSPPRVSDDSVKQKKSSGCAVGCHP